MSSSNLNRTILSVLDVFNGSIHVAQRVVILAQILNDLPLALFDRLFVLFRLLIAAGEVAEDILDSIHPFIINVRLRGCNSRCSRALLLSSIVHELLCLLNLMMVMCVMDLVIHAFELLTRLSFAFFANDEATRLVSGSIWVIGLPIGT